MAQTKDRQLSDAAKELFLVGEMPIGCCGTDARAVSSLCHREIQCPVALDEFGSRDDEGIA